MEALSPSQAQGQEALSWAALRDQWPRRELHFFLCIPSDFPFSALAELGAGFIGAETSQNPLPGMLAYIFNPSTLEAEMEARGSLLVPGQPGLAQ